MLLQTSRIQDFITSSVVYELSQKIHSKVTVGRINYTLFDDISIHDLYVEDQHKDTLLFVGQADAHFNFWKFFRGKIIISSIKLDRLFGNVVINKAGHSNLDFIIDAFKQPPSKTPSNTEFRIRSFKLINSAVKYTNNKELRQLPKGIFNGNKLYVTRLNVNISINVFNKDTLSAKVISLNGIEHTGFVLKELTTQIYASKRGVKIPSFDLQLPESRLHLEDIRVRYDSLGDFRKFFEKVRWNAPISKSYVSFADLKAFVPEFKNLKGGATIKGLITGRISSLHFQKMQINYGKSTLLNADLDVNGLPELREVFIYGRIKELQIEKGDVQDFISQLSNKPFVLPVEVNQLGLVHYKGNITGFLNNLVVFGNLSTNVGSVSSDISLKFDNELRDLAYNGTIKSNDLQLSKLLKNKQLGRVSFKMNTTGTKKENTTFQGVIQAKASEIQFNNYSYRDVLFGGKYDGKGFDGTVDMKDQNLDAHFNGKIDLTQKLPIYDFGLVVRNINLNALKLIPTYPGALLSFTGKTNMVGNSLDNINGFIRFDSIRFKNQNKTLNIDNIQLVSRIQDQSTNFSIQSDYVNGTFSGDFKYSTVGQTIDKIVQKYLPSLADPLKPSEDKYPNHIDIDLTVENTSTITDVLGLPYTFGGMSTVKGTIDEKTNKIDISASIPTFKSSKQEVDNLTLHFNNLNNQMLLTSRGQLQAKDGLQSVFIKASAARDSVVTQLGWQNAQKVTNAGEINAVTKFRNENGKTTAQLSLFPSQVIISDSTWNIHPCTVEFKADSTIEIHNFIFDNHKQFVHINGIASKNQADGLSLDMNKLNLDFIMNLLKLKNITIDGVVTGKATLRSVLHQPIFEAGLDVQDFQLNHKWIGNGRVTSNWDQENTRLLAHGAFHNNSNDTVVVANGIYTPLNDSINVYFKAHNFGIEFLSPYFETVVQNLKGNVSGKVCMFGTLKQGISFSADAFLNQGQAMVKTLRTTYFINDSVHLTRNTIELRHVKIFDQERNPASLNAMISHNGYFQHMKFDAQIEGENMLALNTQAVDNDYFFGKAYANGTVHIFGDEKETNIWVNARSQPQTKCYIQMGGASKASNNSFINFLSKKNNNLALVDTTPHKSRGSDMNVKVNLQIELTPDAQMEMIVDPKGGDMISGTGDGNLRVEFDSYSDIKLYGTYTISKGFYLFTLQNLIRKEFKVDQGSTLAWTGNPRAAQVNIRALYPLTASLKDLIDPNQLGNMRTSIPVNCVLKLTDNLMKPTISFDIDLPQSDEGVKQLVRNTITTDEMMNRQILYLLVFNRFYTPDYMRTATTSNLGTNEALSFATSTLSAQLNNWFSQTFKSNNFSLGVDYRQTDVQSSDYQAQILYQPNNRLIINGNVGYRNDILATTTNKFISDVDFQYLLTESGKLRFKAYNHTVDRYQLRTAAQTQGVGFMYKEDFVSIKDLFGYYWHLLTGTKNKNTNEEKTPAKK